MARAKKVHHPTHLPALRATVFIVYYVLKIAITALLIVGISEVSKRSSLMGAILASIPLVSVMAMVSALTYFGIK